MNAKELAKLIQERVGSMEGGKFVYAVIGERLDGDTLRCFGVMTSSKVSNTEILVGILADLGQTALKLGGGRMEIVQSDAEMKDEEDPNVNFS